MLLQATLKKPVVMGKLELDGMSELTKADVIVKYKRELVHQLEVALRQRLAELTIDDVEFKVLSD